MAEETPLNRVLIVTGTDKCDVDIEAASTHTEENTSKCCGVFKRFAGKSKEQKMKQAILAMVNVANLSLVGVKLWVSIESGSFSISNSALESSGDIFVGILMQLTSLQILLGNNRSYPRGKTVHSLSSVIAAVFMLNLACTNAVINIERILKNEFHPLITGVHLKVVLSNVLLKFALFVICHIYRNHPEIRVLRKDQMTDVCANIMTLVFAYFTAYHWAFDLVGAVLTLILIGYCWFPLLFSQCRKIHGVEASEKYLTPIQEAIAQTGLADDVRIVAYHRSELIIVEVDAVLHKPDESHSARSIIESKIADLDFVSVALVRDVSSLSGRVSPLKCSSSFHDAIDESSPIARSLDS